MARGQSILVGEYTLYTALELNNKGYALGTIGKGLLILSKEGKRIEELNQERGLSNNTVLSLYEDKLSNPYWFRQWDQFN